MFYICFKNKQDKEHNIRFIIGNGLRTDVWKTFLDRYGKNIRVLEFYAATEGNVGFFNLENKIGSIGMYSPLIKVIVSTYISWRCGQIYLPSVLNCSKLLCILSI